MATKQIPIHEIVDNPFQPRKEFDQEALRSLADEMKAEGFWSGSLQGRRTKNGKVQLVFGHRRLRALKLIKADTVPIEIVDLTDAQMALRSLEENLQREGLTDFEKADGVRHAVEIAKADRLAKGQPERGVIQEVANRLGLAQSWVSALCDISISIEMEERPAIEAVELTAKAAQLGKAWGGKAYVKTLIKQAKEAKRDETITKPTEHTVYGMKKVVREAPEAIQEKLQNAIWTGEITTPKEAEQKARRMAAGNAGRHSKNPPPDFETYLVGWKNRFEDWAERLVELAPYLEFLDTAPPALLKPFMAARLKFLAATDILHEIEPVTQAAPRSVGRGHTKKRLE